MHDVKSSTQSKWSKEVLNAESGVDGYLTACDHDQEEIGIEFDGKVGYLQP